MSLSHIANRLKYADDKDWQTFLDQKYDGGHKQVPNPNQETKEHYPRVTVNHAMKDDQFRKHLEDEYKQWKGKSKDTPKPTAIDVSKYDEFVKDATSDLPDMYAALQGVDQSRVDVALQNDLKYRRGALAREKDSVRKKEKEVGKEVSRDTLNRMQESVNIYESYITEKNMMSPIQKLLIDGGQAYAKNLKTKLSWEENMAYEDLVAGWTEDSYTEIACGIHQLLRAKGVKGSGAEEPDDPSVQMVPLSDTQKDVVIKAYAYQQEVFKKLGVTHVTLYRGVEFDSLNTVPPNEGDPVQIQSRPLSSWTTDKTISVGFGSRMVKCHIPVERILMSQLTHEILGGKSADSIWNQSEYCVMGAEELDCEIIHGVYEN